MFWSDRSVCDIWISIDLLNVMLCVKTYIGSVSTSKQKGHRLEMLSTHTKHATSDCFITQLCLSACVFFSSSGPELREGTKYQSAPTCSGKCDSLVSRGHEVTGHTLEMICDDHTGVTIMQHSRPVIVSRHQLFLVKKYIRTRSNVVLRFDR